MLMLAAAIPKFVVRYFHPAITMVKFKLVSHVSHGTYSSKDSVTLAPAPPAARRRSSFVRRVDARIAQPFDETDETRSRIDHHNPKRRNNWIFSETDYMSEVSRRRRSDPSLLLSLSLCLPPSSPCVFGELIYDGISF